MKCTIGILLICIVSLSSCKKEPLKCEVHCGDITIKGQVKNNNTRLGLENVPVTIKWQRSAGCIFCINNDIATLKTDKSGNYNINFTVDSTKFNNSYIEVSIPNDKSFFYEPFASINSNSNHSIGSTGIHTADFELFPKTTLKINVKRLPNKGLTAASIGHSFTNNNSFGDYWWTDKDAVKDTVLVLETATNIFTKITWIKYTGLGQFTDFQDSIKCISNKENLFDISF